MEDLHIHTKYSDGEYDEYQIIEEVIKSGVNEFAICDHDTIEGSKRVYNLLKQKKCNFVFHSGVELSCRLNGYMGGINMHLLFRDFDYNNSNLKSIINKISQLRLKKIDRMVSFVEDVFKIKIPKDKVEEKLKITNSFGKPHLYSIIQEISDIDREIYYRTMDKLDVADLKLDVKETIKKLLGSGTIYLAHPIEIMREYNLDYDDIEKIIAYLKGLGITGVETHHSSQSKNMQEKFSHMVLVYGLKESKGSDFHGPNVKPNLNIGDVYTI